MFIAREQGTYEIVGRILAWSIVHGGPAGNCFCKSMFNGVVYENSSPECETFAEDLPDEQIKKQVDKVGFYPTLPVQHCKFWYVQGVSKKCFK